MKYTIEDTRGGFTLTAKGEPGTERKIEEVGGHGPVERLYAQASALWLELRAKQRAEREAADA